MSVEISGLDDFEETINELTKKFESQGGEVPMEDLFPENFMQTYTEFNNFGEFIENSKWSVETEEDFERIPEDEFDEYVDEHTGFNDWETMVEAGGREYIMRQINAS